MSEHLIVWRTRARWFAAEILIIVTGVLIALALNALYERRADARNESRYLALLSRDIQYTTAQLEEKVGFETAQLRDGIAAYRAISKPTRLANSATISAALDKLTGRRTLVLRDAAYADLVGTGNLRLIRNRELRDNIVEYYGITRAEFEIMNKNNSFYVDELYNSLLIGKGLINPGSTAVGNLTSLSAVNARLSRLLRPGYITEPNYVWRLPADGPEWAQLKSTLLARVRIAALSEHSAQQALARTRELGAALQTERTR